MRKLLISAALIMLTLARRTIAITLLLALMLFGTIIGARAQQVAPDWNTRYNCAFQRADALIQAGDPRYARILRKMVRTTDPEVWRPSLGSSHYEYGGRPCDDAGP